MSTQKLVYLVAGGTAGHINPALCIGEVFQSKGWKTKYISGTRSIDYKILENNDSAFFPARPLVGKNPLKVLLNLLFNLYVFIISLIKFLVKRPNKVIGTGGFVCGPVLLAAKILCIKIYILEPNSVIGFTNKLLAKISDKVFVAFPRVQEKLESNNTVLTGAPLKENFYKTSFSNEDSEELKVFIFGGSLGAKEINDLVDYFIKIDSTLKLDVYHQMGINNFEDYKGELGENVKYHRVRYVDDMIERYKWADMIISRAGAGTVFELEKVAKPCVLIPLSIHKDQHQSYNAKYLKELDVFPVYIGSGEELQKEILNIFEELSKWSQKSSTNKASFSPQEKIYEEVIK